LIKFYQLFYYLYDYLYSNLMIFIHSYFCFFAKNLLANRFYYVTILLSLRFLKNLFYLYLEVLEAVALLINVSFYIWKSIFEKCFQFLFEFHICCEVLKSLSILVMIIFLSIAFDLLIIILAHLSIFSLV